MDQALITQAFESGYMLGAAIATSAAEGAEPSSVEEYSRPTVEFYYRPFGTSGSKAWDKRRVLVTNIKPGSEGVLVTGYQVALNGVESAPAYRSFFVDSIVGLEEGPQYWLTPGELQGA